MTVFNFGSINVDHIYRVGDLVRPGETLATKSYQRMLGGKGANQSIALARAGAAVKHIGRVGTDDRWALDLLADEGIDTTGVECRNEASGHAIIQVTDAGQNAILLHGGANQTNAKSWLAQQFEEATPDDFLLLQNECNLLLEAINLASAKGMKIAFNPAPMTAEVQSLPLNLLDYLIVNELEAEGLASNSGLSVDHPEALVAYLSEQYPDARAILTAGENGVYYIDESSGDCVHIPAVNVDAVDTTAAGDTFIGYFLQQRMAGEPMRQAVEFACKAAAITVQSAGASASIPRVANVV